MTTAEKRKYLIAGAGVSGQAAARLLRYLNETYDVIDAQSVPGMTDAGWNGGKIEERYRTAILSPGIKPGSPMLAAVTDAAEDVAGELAFALRYINCPVTAITGTNGKTTVTELTTALFQALGESAEAAGNIGNGMSDSAIACMEKKTARIVAEVSSFQMEHAAGLKVETAAVLNLASDHIDRHGSMEEYERLKWLLAMSAEKAVVLNRKFRGERWEKIPVPVLTFSADLADADFTLKNGTDICYRGKALLNMQSVKLKGKHNAENIMAAMALCAASLGEQILYDARLTDALKNFAPDHHRMELFLEQNGIRFIDDSKATNPHAVNAALDAVETDGRKNILLLLGGLDKNMNYKELIPHLDCVKKTYLTGQCRNKIAAALDGCCPLTICGDFDEAVQMMCRDALPGDTVLLSPATASMDRFKNYGERGEHFKALCRTAMQKKQDA